MHAVERAFRPGYIGAADRKPDILQADAVGGKPRQIGLDAHRRPNAALNGDVADAGHFGEPLRHQRVGKIAEIAQRDGFGCEREHDDRSVRRVHLGVGGRIGKIARQCRTGGIDRRLHVLGRAVDVAVEIELQA